MNKNIETNIINIDSLHATTYRSSSDFDIILSKQFTNITKIQLLSGNIPSTLEPYLFIDISPDFDQNVYGPLNGNYNGILRFSLPSTNDQNILDMDNTTCYINNPIRYLDRFNIKIWNKQGNIHSFNTNNILITSFTNASPSVLTTNNNHGLSINDIVYVKNFTNGSTTGINKLIHSTTWYINTTPAVNTLTLKDGNGTILDLSTEATNQTFTGYGNTSPLGYGTEIELENGNRIMITLFTNGISKTRITTAVNHGLLNNQDIKISGFNNGATLHDNDLINTRHYILNIIDPFTFDINVILSSYTSPKAKTTDISPFLLGSNSVLYIDKNQCSFDFMIETAPYDIRYNKLTTKF